MEGSKGHLPQSPCLCLRGAVHLIGRTDCGCVCPISKTPHSSGSLRVESVRDVQVHFKKSSATGIPSESVGKVWSGAVCGRPPLTT
ncbi:hypothetical protein GBAR_LOCUS31252 [Geodia barretti]|uniref:Uncharacterized protein n=1 Tax=Geodia barretti TaxID=519541 RepID=A0AA35XLC2_GEOBA|nr:hypothetical protein GBAR_LOCUS31252 [Geodia barretti]